VERHDVGHAALPGLRHGRMHVALLLQLARPGVPSRTTVSAHGECSIARKALTMQDVNLPTYIPNARRSKPSSLQLMALRALLALLFGPYCLVHNAPAVGDGE
jgi:hypothetical protein